MVLSMNQTMPIYPPFQGDIDPWKFTEAHPNSCNENWQVVLFGDSRKERKEEMQCQKFGLKSICYLLYGEEKMKRIQI
eukprot:scaffold12037_cov159-Ochromonas_danica.AAC.14